MADNLTDNIQIVSSDPSGATVATDVVNTVHYQEIKINVGSDGIDALLGDDNPIPVIFTPSDSYSGYYVPVAGSTDGTTPVDVNIASGSSITIGGVTIGGGTLDRILDGVSTDLRTVASGITIGVATVSGESVTVAGTGYFLLGTASNSIGSVDVTTVSIPSTVQAASIEITGDGNTLPGMTVETGFRITNFGPNTAFIGPPSIFASMTADGYPLLQYDSIFLECVNSSSVRSRTVAGETADLRIIGT